MPKLLDTTISDTFHLEREVTEKIIKEVSNYFK